MNEDLNPEPVPLGPLVTLASIKTGIPGLPKIYRKGIVENTQSNKTFKTLMHHNLHIY